LEAIPEEDRDKMVGNPMLGLNVGYYGWAGFGGNFFRWQK